MGTLASIEQLRYKLVKSSICNAPNNDYVDNSEALNKVIGLSSTEKLSLLHSDNNSSIPNATSEPFIPGNIKIAIGLNTISLITCFFWIIVGLDAMSNVHSHLQSTATVKIPPFCVRINTLNWFIVGVALFHTLFRFVPPFLRLVNLLTTKRIN
ncbi:hypothetical protein HOLleu_00263 [Holothuria leucospilota]|uniref:Uncharacterized protein n=1 Tax=Holothuria leucospilota TaxID=206669 RepID=A0A9Q1HJJ7_HOLLE|nr:hypothetical protein HOLleu_00263 [Holothuria leucospilota]